jgi:hypothetical protein
MLLATIAYEVDSVLAIAIAFQWYTALKRHDSSESKRDKGVPTVRLKETMTVGSE